MKKKILLISGSVRLQSYTRSLVWAVALALQEKGAEVVHWDLSRCPLPIIDPDTRSDLSKHENVDVREFAVQAADADAFVWGSPIYHNSYSGVLKNSLDVLGSRHFDYRPVGLVSHGGNGSPQAVDHLRIVARAVGAIAITTNISTGTGDYGDFANGLYPLTSASINSRIGRFSDELLLFADTFKKLRKQRATKVK